MEEQVQSFMAKDAAGQTIVLNVWREVCSVEGSLEPGTTRIATRDGRTVERKGRGQYEVVQTHEQYVSDQPDAP